MVNPGFLNPDGTPGGFRFHSNTWGVSPVPPNRFIRAINDCNLPGPGNTCTMRDTFDITGDGIPDYVIATGTPWTVYPGYRVAPGGTGTPVGGFAAAVSWPAPHTYVRRDQKTDDMFGNFNTRTLQDTVDVNADGRPDLIVAPGGTGTAPFSWQVYVNTGAGFTTTPLPYFKAPSQYISDQGGVADLGGAVTKQMVDMDGDGLLDYLVTRADTVPKQCQTDPDGDGVLEPYNDCLDVYRGTGQGFELAPRTYPLPEWNGYADSAIRRWIPGGKTMADLFDVNGDGLPDLVVVDVADDWWVFLNSGGELQSHGLALKLEGPGAIRGPIRRTYSGGSGDSYDNVEMVDLDGDGMLDRVTSVSGGTWTIERNLNAVKPNLLTVIRNGLNGSTAIRYQPSTMYDNTGGDGIEDLPSITWLVEGFRRTDGLCTPGAGIDLFSTANPCISSGNELVTEFVYQDGRFDVATREFRGFRFVYQIHRGDPAVGQRSDATTLTRFSQTRETKGKVLRTDRLAGNYLNDPSVPLVATDTNIWSSGAIGTPASVRTQVYLTKNVKSENYAGGNHEVVRELSTPDTYGNVSAVRTAGGDGKDCVATVTTFASPQSGAAIPVYNKPASTVAYSRATVSGTNLSTCGGGELKFVEKWFYYDGMAATGSVDKGAVTKVESAVNATTRVAVTMQYGGFGNVTDTWDERGNRTRSIYDSLGLHPVTERNAKLHEVQTAIDYRWGKPKSMRDPNGQFTCYGYDPAGRPSYVVRPPHAPANCDGAEAATKWERYAYHFAAGTPADRYSYVEVERREPQQAGGYLKTTQYFDALARPRYSATPRLVASAASCAASEQTVISGDTLYNAAGQPIAQYDPYGAPFGTRNNGVTRSEYVLAGGPHRDPLGRPNRVTRPDDGAAGSGRTLLTEYGPKKTTAYDGEGHKAAQTVDTYGRVILSEVFDAPGATAPYTRTDTSYDGAGRVLTTKVAGLTATTVTHTYDLLGRKLTTVDPNSGTWSYGYDEGSNLTFQNDPKAGQHIELCYDELNRPTKKFYFANDTPQALTCLGVGAIEYEYDDQSVQGGQANRGVGRLTAVRDRSGEASYRYDLRGRRVQERKEITDDGATTAATSSYEYDDADRVWKTHYPGGEFVESIYDAVGQPESLLRTSGTEVDTIVDCAGYDLFGRLLRLERGNGVVDAASYHGAPGSAQFAEDHALRTRYVARQADLVYLNLEYDDYDRRGFLKSVIDHRHTAAPLSNEADYTYDFAGRLLSLTGTSLSETYGYDPVGNISQVGAVTLTYGTPTRPHQATTATTAGVAKAIAHDLNGNRERKDNSAQVYTYDEDDRVKTITVAGAPTSAVRVVYDYGGQKTVQVSTGAANASVRYYGPLAETSDEGTVTYYQRYYWFGGQRIASRRGTDVSWETQTAGLFGDAVRLAGVPAHAPAVVVVLGPIGRLAVAGGFAVVSVGLLLLPASRLQRRSRRRLLAAPAASLSVTWLLATLPWPLILIPTPAHAGGQGSAEWRHYHYDHLGSVQVITDGAGLNIESIRYTPYGKPRTRLKADGNPVAPVGPSHRQEFTGYETEVTSGLEYAGARFYDPLFGSFLTHDPKAQFANPYSYVGGNPINAADPNGEDGGLLIALLIGFGIGFVAGAVDAAASGADAGTALKAGLIGGAIGAGVGVGLGVVSAGVGALESAAVTTAFNAAQVGAAGYGTVQSVRSENGAGFVVSVVALAFAVGRAYEGLGLGADTSSILSAGKTNSDPRGLSNYDQTPDFQGQFDRFMEAARTDVTMRGGEAGDSLNVFDSYGGRFRFNPDLEASGLAYPGGPLLRIPGVRPLVSLFVTPTIEFGLSSFYPSAHYNAASSYENFLDTFIHEISHFYPGTPDPPITLGLESAKDFAFRNRFYTRATGP